MRLIDVALEESPAPHYARKTLTLVGVFILHGIVFVAVSRIPAPRTKHETEFSGAMFLVEPRRQRDKKPATRPKSPVRTAARETPVVPSIAPVTEPDRSRAITLPSIDWAAERARVAESQVHRESGGGNQRPLISKPKVMELPKKQEFKEHKRGDTERFDDGELRTWINESCYVTNLPPPTPRLDPNAINVQCRIKGRPPIVDGFDHVKPKYLRKEGEAPAKPKSLYTGETITCDYSSTVCEGEPFKEQ